MTEDSIMERSVDSLCPARLNSPETVYRVTNRHWSFWYTCRFTC